jgi:acetolactate synthase-1/2/3 large subunit
VAKGAAPVDGSKHVDAWSDRDRFVESQRAEPGSQRGVALGWQSRFGDEPRKGSDIVIEALEREGVSTVFAYPGGASMEIHQALTRSSSIRNILCRHEQGEIFAAEGYGMCTGEVAVCIATSGPGATNLVTGLADALLDSVPMVAITGQVPRQFIGTDAFQETPIVEITRQITKHNYLVLDVNDIPRIMREAFLLARSGRPGPVLVDIPKDIQQQLHVPDWDQPLQISGYLSRLPPPPMHSTIAAIREAICGAQRPVLYVGGGAQHCADEVTELVRRTGIPIANTLKGLGTFPRDDPLSLSMLGMHGTVAANYAIDSADLLIALGVRFDDRVTGKLDTFATRARIVHVDIDPAEIHKNKHAHIPLCADVKPALSILNAMLADAPVPKGQFDKWVADVMAKKEEFPMNYPTRPDVIMPQQAIEVLSEETNGEAIITTGVGQHQMWAAQYYSFKGPRQWCTSGGLGSMGFGFPSAIGARVAWDGLEGRPAKTVVDIDGDGSFMMNVQELATAAVNGINCKCIVLNNQHLGMVVQWEDRFYGKNRAHTYLGRQDAEWHVSGEVDDIFPDFLLVAEGMGVKAKRIFHPDELRPAIREMLDHDGPFLLDVMVPHIAHVLPMIPAGGTVKDVIVDGDGASEKY